MDPQDAVAILLAARDEPAIKGLSEYQKAEAWVERDSELRAQVEAEAAYYAEHGDLLAGVRLAGAARESMKMQVEAALASRDWAHRGSGIWPMRHPVLAMAAAVMVMAAGVWMYANGTTGGATPGLVYRGDLDAFEEYAAGIVAAGIQLDHRDERPAALMQWFERERGMHIEGLSPGLMALKSMGCKVFDWNGAQVALMCLETSDSQMAHLFITRRENLDLSSAVSQLGCNSCSDREVFSWLDRDLAFVMVAHKKGQRLDSPFAAVTNPSG